MTTDEKRRMSGFAFDRNPFEMQAISRSALAPSGAKQGARQPGETATDALGAPLSIRAVAKMLGCSPWTVRQQHIPAGLPHFRSGRQGKLIFFRDQVVAWVLRQQEKGGKRT